MTKLEIMINYNQAIRQAEKLESLSKRLQKLSQDKMQNTIGRLQNSWQSDNSGLYYQKARQVAEEILTTSKNLNMIATTIRTTAEVIRGAELAALEIAKAMKKR